MNSRFKSQLAWYETKAKLNQQFHAITSSLTIIIAALLPVVLIVGDEFRLVSIILSVVIAFLLAVSHLFEFKNRWLNYRVTAEQLKSEYNRLLSNQGEYADSRQRLAMFVQNVEHIVSRENTSWASRALEPKKEDSS